jgi:hypothetical protein
MEPLIVLLAIAVLASPFVALGIALRALTLVESLRSEIAALHRTVRNLEAARAESALAQGAGGSVVAGGRPPALPERSEVVAPSADSASDSAAIGSSADALEGTPGAAFDADAPVSGEAAATGEAAGSATASSAADVSEASSSATDARTRARGERRPEASREDEASAPSSHDAERLVARMRDAAAGGSRRKAATRGGDLERSIGERLFNRLGTGVLIVGVALFLGYVVPSMGAVGQIALAFVLGTVQLGVGVRTLRSERLRFVGIGLVAGGWATLYTLAFAVHNFEPLRQIESPVVGMLVLGATATAMIAHAVRLGDPRGLLLVHGFAALGIVASTPGPQVGIALAVLCLVQLGIVQLGLVQLGVAARSERSALAVSAIPITLLGQLAWLIRSTEESVDVAALQWVFVVQAAVLGAALWQIESSCRARSEDAGAAVRRQAIHFALARTALLLGTALLLELLEGGLAKPGPWPQLAALAALPAIRAGRAFLARSTHPAPIGGFAVSVTLSAVLASLAIVHALDPGGAQIALLAVAVVVGVLARTASAPALAPLAAASGLLASGWAVVSQLGRALRVDEPDAAVTGLSLVVAAAVLHGLGRGLRGAAVHGPLLHRIAAAAGSAAFAVWCLADGVDPRLSSVALSLGGLVLLAQTRAEALLRKGPASADSGLDVPALDAAALIALAGVRVLPSMLVAATAAWSGSDLADARGPVLDPLPVDVAWLGIPAPLWWGGVPAVAAYLVAAWAGDARADAGPGRFRRSAVAVVGLLLVLGLGPALLAPARAPAFWAFAASALGGLAVAARGVEKNARRDLLVHAWIISAISLVVVVAETFAFGVPDAAGAVPDLRALLVRWGIAVFAMVAAISLRECPSLGLLRADDGARPPSIATPARTILATLVVAALAAGIAYEWSERPHVWTWPSLAVLVAVLARWKRDREALVAARVALVAVAVRALDAGWPTLASGVGSGVGTAWLGPAPSLVAIALVAELWRSTRPRHDTGPYLEPVLFVAVGATYFDTIAEGGYLTVAISALGVLLVVHGFARSWQGARIVGLVTLGGCVLKAFFRDLAGLDPFYRAASFLVLGAALVGVSLVYARFERGRGGSAEDGSD